MDIILLILIILLFLFLLAFYMLRFFETVLPLMFWGPIYVPTKRAQVKKIIEIANIKLGDRVADLGAGDGRLVIALAEAGAEVHGYEINPLLVRLARKNILKENVANKAFIQLKNFWRQDFSDFDVITVYGMDHVMGKLEAKLKKELKTGARILFQSATFLSLIEYFIRR